MPERYIPSRASFQLMNERYEGGGEGHEEQVVMSAIGDMLKRARENRNISIETVATALKKKPEYIAQAELGAILPYVFFEILAIWAKTVGISYERVQREIKEIQDTINPRHIAALIATAQKYNTQDLALWMELGKE